MPVFLKAAEYSPCGSIITMWPVGRAFADPVQDQRGAGRLAGTGRAEQREVLAEHCIDVDAGADVGGRIDRADLDRVAPVGGVDLPEVGGGGRIDQRAGDRIAGHAAAEAVDAPGELFLVALAHEIDVGEDALRRADPASGCARWRAASRRWS